MSDGGWCNCAPSMTGTVFSVYSNIAIVSFMEVMAYTQKALQINTDVTVTSIGAELFPFVINNAGSKTVILDISKSG